MTAFGRLLGNRKEGEQQPASTDGREKSFCIFDPALQDVSGHHFHYSLVLARTALALGHRPFHFVNSAANLQSIGLPNTRTLFKNIGYDILARKYRRRSRPDWTGAVTSFAGQLDRSGLSHLGGDLVIAFPTILHFQQRGVAEWLLSNDLSAGPAVYLWHLYDAAFRTSRSEQVGWIEAELQQGFQALNEASSRGARITIVCETEHMKEHLEALGARNVRVLLPIGSHTFQRRPPPNGADRIPGHAHVVFPGHIHQAKGFHLMPDILRETWKARPDVRFTIQSNPGPGRERSISITRELRRLGPKVRIVYGALHPRDLEQLMAAADIVLLPYDPEAYRRRGSSILSEALAIGRPSVAPAGASFAKHAIENGLCFGFEGHDPESIAAALTRAIDDLPNLRQRIAQAEQTGLPGEQKLLELFEGL